MQNAVRYANSRVEIGLTRNAAEEFELTVDDDGGGIPQADRERVFEPFIRRTKAATEAPAAPAWGWPSCNGWPPITAAPSRCGTVPGRRPLRAALAGLKTPYCGVSRRASN